VAVVVFAVIVGRWRVVPDAVVIIVVVAIPLVPVIGDLLDQVQNPDASDPPTRANPRVAAPR